MPATKLPIAGYPHLALAAQHDERLHRATIANLKTRGFTVEPSRLVPPEGAGTTHIIAAITQAFQSARQK